MPEVIDAVRVGTLLFAGGQGTAARYLTNAIKMIAEQPELQEQLRDDPSGIKAFTEEMLRFGSPVKTNFRMARHSTTLGGVDIPAGSVLILLLGAANRDPRQFECPAEFHTDRANARQNIAFGKGVHFCPGAPLVRSEGPITVSRMLSRLADIRISREAPWPSRRPEVRAHTQLHPHRGRCLAPRVHADRLTVSPCPRRSARRPCCTPRPERSGE